LSPFYFTVSAAPAWFLVAWFLVAWFAAAWFAAAWFAAAGCTRGLASQSAKH
jgi:hypothetical protein